MNTPIPTYRNELESSGIAYNLICRAAAAMSSSDELKNSSATIKKAVVLCRRHWSQPGFNIESLAAKMEIHRTTLSRLFSQQAGITLNQYITQMRLQNAQSLLQQTNLSISEIARQCGFDDPNYFSRLFSKHQGVPPTQFRKQQ